jgi:hypothetical protein
MEADPYKVERVPLERLRPAAWNANRVTATTRQVCPAEPGRGHTFFYEESGLLENRAVPDDPRTKIRRSIETSGWSRTWSPARTPAKGARSR